MKKTYTEEDILEITLAKEIQSQRLYLSLASFTDDPEVKDLLLYMANEEKQHSSNIEFESMKKGYTVDTEQSNINLQDDDDLTNLENKINVTKEQILELAIKKEADAFQLFVEMVPYAEDEELRQMLLELAEEEVRHKQKFMDLYERICERPYDDDSKDDTE